jgi:hypothetical protein
MRSPLWLMLVVLAAASCDDEMPPPPPIGAATDSPGGALPSVGIGEPSSTTGTTTAGATAGSGATAGTTATTGVSATATTGVSVTATATTGVTAGPTASAGNDTDPTDTDASATEGVECNSACDCPPFTRCTADGCEPSSQAVYCCGEPTCPSGAACETPAGGGGMCP